MLSIRGQTRGHRGACAFLCPLVFGLRHASNQDMLTAVFRAVVERFKLQGERLGMWPQAR